MWNGDYEDDYDEPDDEEPAQGDDEDEICCNGCGELFCRHCNACHQCEREHRDWRDIILKCEQRQRDSIPEELRVSEGL